MSKKAKRLVKGSLAAKRHMAKLRRLAITKRKSQILRGPGYSGKIGKPLGSRGRGQSVARGPGWSARYNPSSMYDKGHRLGLFFGKKGKTRSYEDLRELSIEVANANKIWFGIEEDAVEFGKGFATGYEDAQVSSRSKRKANPTKDPHNRRAVAKRHGQLYSPSEVKVTVWDERDRLHIAITDRATEQETIAEWWDDDAREMFDAGFFRSGPGLKQSVIEYAKSVGLLVKGNPLVMTVMGNPSHSEEQVRRAVIASGYTPADADQVVYEWATTGRLPMIVRAHLRSPLRFNCNPGMCRNPGHGHGHSGSQPTHWIICAAPGNTKRDLFIPSFEGSFRGALQEAREYAARNRVETQLWEADPASYRRQGWFKKLWATVRPHGGYEIVRGLQRNPVQGWAVTHDGETLKTFQREQDAMKWMHDNRHGSIDFSVKHEGYDIVQVSDGKVLFSYKRDILNKKMKKNPAIKAGYKFLAHVRAAAVKSLVERLNRQGAVFYYQSASPSGGRTMDFFILSRDLSLAQDVLAGHYGNPSKTRGRKFSKNPGKGRRRKITMTLQKFAEWVKAKRDPKLWRAFLKKFKGFEKWTHGSKAKTVTLEQVDVPGVNGVWITYGAGKAPETAYVMPRGTKRKGAWIHQWDTMPDLKNDPEAGIIISKLKGKSRITDFLHR